MNILGLQETDWLTRGPHTQHHIFERLSKNPKIKITVLDYDIDKIIKSKSLLIKRQIYSHADRAVKNSNVIIIRTAHLQVPYLRRITSLVTNFIEILKFIKKNHVDLIIAFSITNGLEGLILAKIFNIPFIFYYIDLLHTLVPVHYAQSLARAFSRFLFKASDHVVVVTKSLQEFVLREGVPHEKVNILLNGISLENTVVDREKLEKLKLKHAIKDNDFIILYMGFLYNFAGLKEIIDYYNSEVKNGNFALKFIIVGDGDIYHQLIDYIERLKADWVILTGKVPFFEVTEYIELADLCLMSFELNEITKDITPVKVMEYMAMKKPVLSNSLPTVISEIGKDNGVIFAKNQLELIKKIKQLSIKKAKLKAIGKKGFDLIEKYYVWPKILNNLKKLIIELIKKKRKF
ncbi:MAG: glycosyltransferase [Promethearchaeota archaeon]